MLVMVVMVVMVVIVVMVVMGVMVTVMVVTVNIFAPHILFTSANGNLFFPISRGDGENGVFFYRHS